MFYNYLSSNVSKVICGLNKNTNNDLLIVQWSYCLRYFPRKLKQLLFHINDR